MSLEYIPTKDQDADILKKALTWSKFEFHKDRIWVEDNPFIVERECWNLQQETLKMAIKNGIQKMALRNGYHEAFDLIFP